MSAIHFGYRPTPTMKKVRYTGISEKSYLLRSSCSWSWGKGSWWCCSCSYAEATWQPYFWRLRPTDIHPLSSFLYGIYQQNSMGQIHSRNSETVRTWWLVTERVQSKATCFQNRLPKETLKSFLILEQNKEKLHECGTLYKRRNAKGG